jgi:hypothetical protein
MSFCAAGDGAGQVLTSSTPTVAPWTATLVDSIAGSSGIDSISCPVQEFCAAVDNASRIFTSTDPAGGRGWQVQDVSASIVFPPPDAHGHYISCPSIRFCAAVGSEQSVFSGGVVVSTDPTDGSNAVWTNHAITGSNTPSAISCPSTSFCAVVDNDNLFWSTNPTAGSYTETPLIAGGGTQIQDISCPSATLCVASDQSGNIIWSTRPTAGASSWHKVNIDGSHNLQQISCPTTTLCVTGDENGNILASTTPASLLASSWVTSSGVTSGLAHSVWCSAAYFCAAVDDHTVYFGTSTEPIPVVTAVSPNSGPAGTQVTITGENFDGASSVNFGGTPAASFTLDSSTQITAIAPPGSGTVDVTVTAGGGTSQVTTADQFIYSGSPPLPTVSAVSPSSGPPAGGTTVTISGSGFTDATTVSFGGTPAASFTVNSDSQITAVSPAGSGTVDVTVTGPSGTSAVTPADQFTYTSGPVPPLPPPAPPTVTSVSPSSGPASGCSTVRITGTNLTGATAVRFGSSTLTPGSPPGTCGVSYVRNIGHGFQLPYGVTTDAVGNVYVSDTRNGRVQKFTADGTLLASWGAYNHPYGVATDADSVYIVDAFNYEISKRTLSGTPVTHWGAGPSGRAGDFGSYPTGIATDGLGHEFVVDPANDRVEEFSSAGRYVNGPSFRHGAYHYYGIGGVAIDPAGFVYVTDAFDGQIDKFTSAGTLVAVWGSKGSGPGQMSNPSGISLDPEGNVWITDNSNDRIEEWSSSGQFLGAWGSPGTGPLQFNDPTGIAISGSSIYVVDEVNNRVQQLSLPASGSFTGTFVVNSPTQITAVSPPGSGNVDVTVSTPAGTSVTNASDRYSYQAIGAAGAPSSVTASSFLCGTGGSCNGLPVVVSFINVGSASVQFAATNTSFSGATVARVRAVLLGTLKRAVVRAGRLTFVFKLRRGRRTSELFKEIKKHHLKRLRITITLTSGGRVVEQKVLTIRLKE